MSLGTNISRLRAEKHLSQGDLAEALDVSRQSVSKWETDASVPDLDKLVKLSQVFDVSLDELVTGAAPSAEEAPPREAGTPPPQAVASGRLPGRKIAGIVLFCMAFLTFLVLTAVGGVLEGLILAMPFLVCGVICFAARRRPGLWCAWAMYLMADVFFHYVTGLNWRYIFRTFSVGQMGTPVYIVTAWIQVLVTLALLIGTVRSFRREPLPLTRRSAVGLAALWLGFLAAYFLPLSQSLIQTRQFPLAGIVSTAQGIASLLLLAAALTLTARCFTAWRAGRRGM